MSSGTPPLIFHVVLVCGRGLGKHVSNAHETYTERVKVGDYSVVIWNVAFTWRRTTISPGLNGLGDPLISVAARNIPVICLVV